MKMNTNSRVITLSKQYWKRAQRVIMDGSLLYSKSPYFNVDGISPIYLQRGKGAYVYDVDGNQYIDYSMGFGPILLGYGYPRVVEAIKKQLKEGTIFSLAHPLEVKCAELLVESIPCAQMVRFFKTGSSAMSAAVRIARAYTGRDKVIKGRYHGWHDWTIAGTKRCGGIPKSLKSTVYYAPYNNFEKFEQLFIENKGEISAVAIEPIYLEEPKNDFLKELLILTHKYGALLIFDEIVTGFRFSIGGAQEYFGITPDLAAFGKGMANGMPLSAVVGRAEIMQKVSPHLYISSTFAGETLSLAAFVATLEEIKSRNIIEHIWKLGQHLKRETNKIAQMIGVSSNIECIGLPPRMDIIFKDEMGKEFIELKTLFWQEVIRRGVLLGWNTFISFSHKQEDIDYTIGVFKEAMKICRETLNKGNILERLEGGLVYSIDVL